MSEIEIIAAIFFSGLLILAFCGITWVEVIKRKHQKDLLDNSLPADDPKQSHLKAGFIVCLGEDNDHKR